MESMVDSRDINMENFMTYKEKMPELGRIYTDYVAETYKDGAISSKHKRLMALTGALVHGCEACMLAQTNYALELGASVEEILETCAVAVSLGGTMAAGQTTKIIQFLKELGKIE